MIPPFASESSRIGTKSLWLRFVLAALSIIIIVSAQVVTEGAFYGASYDGLYDLVTFQSSSKVAEPVIFLLFYIVNGGAITAVCLAVIVAMRQTMIQFPAKAASTIFAVLSLLCFMGVYKAYQLHLGFKGSSLDDKYSYFESYFFLWPPAFALLSICYGFIARGRWAA